MKLIKHATTYKCQLPPATALEQHLAEHAFTDVRPDEIRALGFVPVMDDRYVLPYPGGYAFKLRFDEKILPWSIVNEEARKRLDVLIAETGGNPTKQLKNKFVEEVYSEFVKTALVKSARITAYYQIDEQMLLVATTGKRFADALTNRLVKAVGSIKATTIYINGITQSLTEKLHRELEGGDGFAGFDVGGVCKLAGENGTSASVKLDSVKEAKEGIVERIRGGQQVVELELHNDDVSFRLDKRFVSKGIFFKHDPGEDGFEASDDIEAFQHEASCQMLWLTHAFRDLLTLFEYQLPELAGDGGAP
ncbi:recombination-associated protein RdgC [Methylococcaceae bacterium WWC4]|nr:recombination-associated protein RdgC [Methylococcaceae bacterium WWC4]